MRYEDIRVGDRIRTTAKYKDITITMEGVVAIKRDGALLSKDAGFVKLPGTTYTLLDRPTPGLPPSGTWVRFRPTYSNKWKIGQVQTSFSVSFVETLDNVYDQEEIAQFEEISWIAVTEG